MTGRRRGPNPWLVLIVGGLIGLPVAWWIFQLVISLASRLAAG